MLGAGQLQLSTAAAANISHPLPPAIAPPHANDAPHHTAYTCNALLHSSWRGRMQVPAGAEGLPLKVHLRALDSAFGGAAARQVSLFMCA